MRITVVSYRGGSGKSLFAINLAASLVYKTLLIEADFLAPTLSYLSNPRGHYWNDYLSGTATSKDIINSLANIDVVFTKPEDEDVLNLMQNKDVWVNRFYDRIAEFLVEQEKYYQFILIDNQSGRFISSVTHTFFADFLICILRPDRVEVSATANYLKSLKKEYYLVWNHVLHHSDMNEVIQELTDVWFAPQTIYKGTLGTIPLDEDTAYQRWVQKKIFIKNTPFSSSVQEIAKQIALLVMEREKKD
jgi:MinD-like ATPase involved in chromosome partitioning or flagellar assembly